MKRLLLLASTTLLAACAANRNADPLLTPPPASEGTPAAPATAAATPAPIPAKNPELAAFFAKVDQEELALSPLAKSYRGIKDADYGKWDQYTDEAELAQQELRRRHLAELRQRFDRAALSPEDQLSYDVFVARAERSEALFPYRDSDYVFDQMNGAQSQAPAFLINIHRVTSVADAEAYVSRLSEMARAIDQAVAESDERAAKGILPPRWVYPYVLADARNVISGAPFGSGQDSALWADFKGKVDKLPADAATKQRLLDAGRTALLNDVRPAYQRLIAAMQRQQKQAGTQDGIWRLANGAEYYRALLKNYTTTDRQAVLLSGKRRRTADVPGRK